MKAIGLGRALAIGLTASACATARGVGATEASLPDACPSDDFETFLQRFADVRDASVRRRYTADPLRHEVPPHVAGMLDDVAGFHGRDGRGEERLDLFSYRFSPDLHGYIAFDDHAADAPATPVPADIGLLPRNGRRVVFGAEHDVELYFFTRSEGCWVLTDLIDPRD